MKARVFGLIGCLLFGAAAVSAQTNADVNAGLQFNFAPPGARSLGLGGAFTGLADDATAAYANPAGLVKLSKPEVSAEFRDWNYNTTFPSGGSYPAGRNFRSSSDSSSDLSYLSLVYPLQNWSFSVFRHQLSSFDTRRTALGINVGTVDDPATTSDRTASLSLDLASSGAAASYRFNDSFSLGLSLSYYQYELSAVSADPANDRQIANGDDSAIGGSVGALWAHERWSVGAVYRHIPEFEGSSKFLCGPMGLPGRSGACTGLGNDVAVSNLGGSTRFNVPDAVSLGLGFQPNSRITLSLEYDRIRYSEISDNITNVLTVARGQEKNFSVDDGDEYHLGAELRVPLASQRSLFLRAGGWLDPDHSLRYSGSTSPLLARFGTDADRNDEIHYAIGLGFAYAQSFQIDAAADFSDPLDTLSLSAVYRF